MSGQFGGRLPVNEGWHDQLNWRNAGIVDDEGFNMQGPECDADVAGRVGLEAGTFVAGGRTTLRLTERSSTLASASHRRGLAERGRCNDRGCLDQVERRCPSGFGHARSLRPDA